MRALKKIMAGAIATAIAATMATSAFAAELKDGKMYLSEDDVFTAEGQTTVLVVPYDVWVNDALVGLEDADIFYIDQWENAEDANDAIEAGLGVKLTEGELADINEEAGAADYYVLFGQDGNITALECVIGTAPQVSTVKGDVTNDNIVTTADLTAVAKHVGKIEYITDVQLLKNGDVANNDNLITAADLTKVAQYVGKIITSFE